MKYILTLFAILLLASCQQKRDKFSVPEKTPIAEDSALEGKKLMETHCYLCHSPTAPENEGRIAPPMIAVKSRYLMDFEKREDFIAAIASFSSHPKPEQALMKGAVKKFGIMPQQAFPNGAVEKIAAFMFDYQIEAPEWFKTHWETNHGVENWEQHGKKLAQNNAPKTTEEIGLEYALSTKKELGKNLMTAIQKDGTAAAMEFCHVEALPLTDRMAKKHQANIKRVSDKNRNPLNKANEEELSYIAHYKKMVKTGEEMKPIVVEKESKVRFYYPITTNTMCLQCHGKPENIKPEVLQKIKTLYPNDLAVGYEENEVRGIWSIDFEKAKQE
jgi:hypothetical protein